MSEISKNPSLSLSRLPGFVVGAPRSGGGKTTVTLGLLRALANAGQVVQPFKCGPDYIDPAFHARAAQRTSVNLDSWSMREGLVERLVADHSENADFAIAEGLMGLFDGVATPGAWGTGASADLSAKMCWPVLLVLDVSGQSQTAAAVATGFAKYRQDVEIAGVILNKVGSDRHIRLIRTALEDANLNFLGALPRNNDITLPERHLGLVVAEETDDLESKLEALADFISQHIDLTAITALATQAKSPTSQNTASGLISPPGQRIALARDAAFSFIYPHITSAWKDAGAEILPFSPLADEAPAADSDVVWLPGGYPELHAGTLANAHNFLDGLRTSASSKPVHGECGGFMVLGEGIEDKTGTRFGMAGLLNLETSFHKRKMNLGYRKAELKVNCPIGQIGTHVTGHEFHYATTLKCEEDALAEIFDAQGRQVAETGAKRGFVSGSFFHMIDHA